jgi:hypothetical protein
VCGVPRSILLTDFFSSLRFSIFSLNFFSFLFSLDSAEVEAFIASDEFLEKTYEEFFRCDTSHMSRLNATQLLLACLHLEQDLRPLLPPQSAKHRQPCPADVEAILQKFATPGTSELDSEQFIEFSRVLFRSVCGLVKV